MIYAFLVPIMALCVVIDGESISHFLSGRELDPVEGVWKFPEPGAMFLIYRTSDTNFDIMLLDSPNLNTEPNKVIGRLCVTARAGYYEGIIDAKSLGEKRKVKHNNVVFNVTDNDMLCVKSYRQGYSVSINRLIYRLLKISVIDNDERPGNLTGAIRIYPFNQVTSPVCL